MHMFFFATLSLTLCECQNMPFASGLVRACFNGDRVTLAEGDPNT